MKCNWRALCALLPSHVAQQVDKLGKDSAQEIRLRLGKQPELITQLSSYWLQGLVSQDHIRHVLNCATSYSPWAHDTLGQGYVTAPGGHRIGLCGSGVFRDGIITGQKQITSVNIRVARDFTGIADKISVDDNLLILGAPGSGKTTFLRDLVRRISREYTISVVDERGEVFPDGFETGDRTDILCGCRKCEGIPMVLRTMGPTYIAVDEITQEEDCRALESAMWCGVRLIATAHASSVSDLQRRLVYKPLVASGIFEQVVVLHSDKTYHVERLCPT